MTIHLKSDSFDRLPPVYPTDLMPAIGASVRESGKKLIVLDDDPTGTQTVYNVPVLTGWSIDQLVAELRDPAPLVYILTNSRSLPEEQAITLTRQITANLQEALRLAPRPIDVISRSDSTLRGHFPAEIEALQTGLDLKPDGILLIPCFFEGGRFTIDDIHYVAESNRLIPAAETDYAKDSAFGYSHSNLRDWITEKYGDSPPPIESFSIADLRQGRPDLVRERLCGINGGTLVIVNAADRRDLEIFVSGLLQAEQTGKRFIARTAASYVQVRAGIIPRGLLRASDLAHENGNPGLIVAGSYIQKSTTQINKALQLPEVAGVEVNVQKLMNDQQRDAEIRDAIEKTVAQFQAGQDVLVYTGRQLLIGSDPSDSLKVGQAISSALVEIVRDLPVNPGWIIAKGGITSSDIATKALHVRRAVVMGQLLPGVPVWHINADHQRSALTYVVFPGNVGEANSLAQAITLLRGE